MRTLAIVQARTGSTRLPGKVLADLGGRPMLALMLARLEAVDVEELIVATSMDPRDDAVAEISAAAGVVVVRGSEPDVLDRFVSALDASPADVVVRLTADCPLIDPAVVNQAIATRFATGADYASNTLVRTFPDGLDVEVVHSDALRAAAAEATDPVEREHVTPFVYRRPERFSLANVLGPEFLGYERWTVDTMEDITHVRDIVARLDNPVTAGWQDVLAVAGRHASPRIRPVPVPEPHIAGQPFVRRWAGDPDGWAEVSVQSAIGRLTGSIELIGLVRTALTGDLQVSRLEVHTSLHGNRGN